jgi:hypothetical protein
MNVWQALLTIGAYVAAPDLVDEIEGAEDILGDIAANLQARQAQLASAVPQCAGGCG